MPNDILITPGSASIAFSGSADSTIRLQVEPSGSVAFYGTSGSLFSIVDSLEGSLVSVNDVSGIPILEVFSDDRVVMGTFNQNTLVVTGSNVGIGTATPNTKLQVVGNITATTFTGPLTGNATTATTLQTARTINGVSFNGSENITLPTVNTSGNQTIDGVKTFSTAIGITGTSNAAGRFYAGTTNPSNTTRLNYDGHLHVNQLNAVGEITAFFSDERLKNFHGKIPFALSKVMSLTGYYFTENEVAKSLGYNNDKMQVGLSAQEVQVVMPEVVTEAPISNEYLTVRYEKLIPLLVEAIKEQQKQIEELKSKLDNK
jgi:hypothetical protein